jgi:hypothetical protein
LSSLLYGWFPDRLVLQNMALGRIVLSFLGLNKLYERLSLPDHFKLFSLLTMMPWLIFNLSFTTIAIFAIAIGILLIFGSDSNTQLLAGSALLFLGMNWRFEGVFPAVLIAVLAMFTVLLRVRKLGKLDQIGMRWLLQFRAAFSVMTVFLGYEVPKLFGLAGDSAWKAFWEINASRSFVVDYALRANEELSPFESAARSWFIFDDSEFARRELQLLSNQQRGNLREIWTSDFVANLFSNFLEFLTNTEHWSLLVFASCWLVIVTTVHSPGRLGANLRPQFLLFPWMGAGILVVLMSAFRLPTDVFAGIVFSLTTTVVVLSPQLWTGKTFYSLGNALSSHEISLHEGSDLNCAPKTKPRWDQTWITFVGIFLVTIIGSSSA